jgi:hypothetical protein
LPVWNVKDDTDWYSFHNCIKYKFDLTKIKVM